MPSNLDAPLKTYLGHLARGELAYQFSPEAGRAVFYPRILCPFTGSDRLEWRISKGLGTVYATTVVHPIEAMPFNVSLISEVRRSNITWPMPLGRLGFVSATSLSSPTAAPNAASAASRRLCARSIPTKRPSSHSYRPVPMRSPLRDTFMSSAQPASSLLPWRWQRANGRCLTRLRGRRSR